MPEHKMRKLTNFLKSPSVIFYFSVSQNCVNISPSLFNFQFAQIPDIEAFEGPNIEKFGGFFPSETKFQWEYLQKINL